MNEEEERHSYYTVTPKGHIALNLMEFFGVSIDEAADISQKIEDDIFNGGYVYLHHTRIKQLNEEGDIPDGMGD
jgi:hypothetical protein